MVKPSLYDILSITKEATNDEIKKAYYKRALKVHPDKLNIQASIEEREHAKEQFQNLSLAYSVLSNETQRKLYDLTGSLPSEYDSSMSEGGGRDWEQYWRDLFPKISKQDLDDFERRYKGKLFRLCAFMVASIR
jgi:DnaJ homolog subfamily C member 9